MKNNTKKPESGLMVYRFTAFTVHFKNFAVFLMLVFSASGTMAQNRSDSLNKALSLNDIVKYALKNQPLIKQSVLDEQIAEKDIQIRLSDWLPQVNLLNTYDYNIKKPVSAFPNISDPTAGGTEFIATGLYNVNTLGISASQTIFNNSVRIAASSARYYRTQARQNTVENKISIVVDVSKAFYDLLLTQQQTAVLDEDIERLKSNAKDAEAQYQNGTSDKIDFAQARIALNNSKSQRFATGESIKGKYAYLRQLMGLPENQQVTIAFDSLAMLSEVNFDSTQRVDYGKRIEYQLVETGLQLQKANYEYYKYEWLPNISAFGNYNLVNQDDQFSHLFDRSFPNSTVGLNIAIPIFTGTKRIQNQRKAALQIKRMELDELNLKNVIQTQYSQSLATYRGYLNQFAITEDNVKIARQVYGIVKLQYQQGIKPYLNLIQAETDLRTSELNYLNALFQVLNSKLDVQQALGTVNINPN